MPKPPSFPFYAKDWLADTRELGVYGRGILIDLIALCWENGSVTDDATTVAAAVGADEKQLLKLRSNGSTIWDQIRAKFSTDSAMPGRLLNPRLEVERAGQIAYREEQSVKGKLSAAKRAREKEAQRFNRGSTVVQPDGQPKSNSSTCDVRHAGDSYESPPVSPVTGGATTPDLFGQHPPPPAKAPTRAQVKAAERATHEADARTVLAALSEARIRSIPGAQPLTPTAGNLKNIASRLADGATLDQCLHVIAVREASTRSDPTQAQWFDPVTPFTVDGFARDVGKPIGLAPNRPRVVGMAPKCGPAIAGDG